jgi:hypothetical protein
MGKAVSCAARVLVALAAVAATGLAGCGTDARPSTSSGNSPPAAQSSDSSGDETAAEKRLLNAWTSYLVPTLLIAKERRDADQQGDTAGAADAERRLNSRLKTIQGWGRDARKGVLNWRNTDPAKAVIADGDGWSEWAYELLQNPPRGDFKQARHIADLGSEAIARHQRAYRAVGLDIPPEFRSQ